MTALPHRAPKQAPLQLQARAITSHNFAPYGWVAQADGAIGRPINGGNSLRLDAPDTVGTLALTADGGVPCLAVFRAQARSAHGPWQQLERHRLGTQTFVPMGGVSFVVLVALGEDAPDPASLAVFVVNGQQAVTLRAGTWHHGLIALSDGDFVVIERSAQQADCDLAMLPLPVTVALAG